MPTAPECSEAELPELGGFPFVGCVPCGRNVMAYAALAGVELVHVCSICGSVGAATFFDRSSLDELGLTIAARPVLEAKTPKKSGCSKGCSASRAPGTDKGESSSGGCGSSCSCSKAA